MLRRSFTSPSAHQATRHDHQKDTATTTTMRNHHHHKKNGNGNHNNNNEEEEDEEERHTAPLTEDNDAAADWEPHDLEEATDRELASDDFATTTMLVDSHSIEFGTLAEQGDESHYDDNRLSSARLNTTTTSATTTTTSATTSSSSSDRNHEQQQQLHHHDHHPGPHRDSWAQIARLPFPQDVLYGRDEELQQLRRAWESFFVGGASGSHHVHSTSHHSTTTTTCRIVWLGGYSGTGKSSLIRHFLSQHAHNVNVNNSNDHNSNDHNSINSNPPTKPTPYPPQSISCLHGKFDAKQSSQPFSALSAALNGYLLEFQSRYQSDSAETRALQTKLQQWADIDGPRSENFATLCQTVAPALAELYDHPDGEEQPQPQPQPPGTLPEEEDDGVEEFHPDGAAPQTHLNHREDDEGQERQKVSSLATTVQRRAKPPPPLASPNITTRDIHSIQLAVSQFLRALAAPPTMKDTDTTQPQPATANSSSSSTTTTTATTPPLILFLDDLQWADVASLQILTGLLQEFQTQQHQDQQQQSKTTTTKSSSNNSQQQPKLLFVGAYRSNEVQGDDHPFSKMKQALLRQQQEWQLQEPLALPTLVESTSAEQLQQQQLQPQHGTDIVQMELSNLSPDSIGDFIADCLGGPEQQQYRLQQQQQQQQQQAIENDDDNDDTTTDKNAPLLLLQQQQQQQQQQNNNYNQQQQGNHDVGDQEPYVPLYTAEDVLPITEAVYSKTLGNIFAVQQALEELARKNVIYYDVISFSWQYSRSAAADNRLESVLSENVVQMVQQKLQTLPAALQRALALQAFTHPSVPLDLLFALFSADAAQRHWPAKRSVSFTELETLMRLAFKEGLVLKDVVAGNASSSSSSSSSSRDYFHRRNSSETNGNSKKLNNNNNVVRKKQSRVKATYKFAHDRIREAACASIPQGPERDQLLYNIATVLLERVGFSKDDNEEDFAASDGAGADDGDDDDGHSQSSSHTSMSSSSWASLLRNTNNKAAKGSSDVSWMLFTAASHLNSLSDTVMDSVHVARLNLLVAKIAISKGAFGDALTYLKAALNRLEDNHTPNGDKVLAIKRSWKHHYELRLELLNHVTESERSLGDFESALEHAQEIFDNARTLSDQFRAQSAFILVHFAMDREGSVWIEEGLNILAKHGMANISPQPHIGNVVQEVLKLKMALKGRSLLCLKNYPTASDPAVLQQIAMTKVFLINALMAKQDFLIAILAHRMVGIALKKKIVFKELPTAVCVLQFILWKMEQWKPSFSYTTVVSDLVDRFPESYDDVDGLESRVGLLHGSLYYGTSYRDSIEPYLDLNRALISRGMADTGLGVAWAAVLAFFIASFPLNALIESKVILLEEMASTFGRKTFLLSFKIYRQCIYNLMGGSGSAILPVSDNSYCLLDGSAFREAESKEECDADNIQDIATLRLMLAVYFDDHETMEQMLDVLSQYEVDVMYIERQNLRMTYAGFASMMLRRKNKKHSKWANIALKFWRRLATAGSVNALPIHACMEALNKPSIDAFEKAIRMCGEGRLTNLVALMSERCGLWIYETVVLGEKVQERCSLRTDNTPNDSDFYKDYLKHALFSYQGWGAMGKVSHLSRRFEFLRTAVNDKPASNLSSDRAKAARMGLPTRAVAPMPAGSASASDF